MAIIKTNFNIDLGKIKPMHAAGQPPFSSPRRYKEISYLTEANIPYSRLHDVGGPYGLNRYVDIPNLFRDFGADENDPESYDFAFTDVLIKAMAEYNVSPIFRLGVTIENDFKVKAYRIHPPADPAKWARVCEHVVRHYNEGWANGFHYGIEYWEVWNEPENHFPGENQMWTGTAEQYYELYGATARQLKACFGDSIKIGGYGATGFYYALAHPDRFGLDIKPRTGERYTHPKEEYRVNFFLGFLEYVKKNALPLDFFSYHSYVDVEDTALMVRFARKILDEYGFAKTTTMLNEWNNSARLPLAREGSEASARACNMICTLQNEPVDMLCYYDTRTNSISDYAGMFNPMTKKPYCLYYGFKAFGELYRLGRQVKTECDDSELTVLAATDGESNGLIIVNTSNAEKNLITDLCDSVVYLINEECMMTETELNSTEFTLPPYTIAFIK